ncbi:hypothetical protein J4437_05465 [Candidatus Woesearchaeota archaeon]|nr:hypothetical protein [Candidatus Woesearchaeota archaeon]
MNLEEKIYSLYYQSFNAKFALISASFNGPIASLVNYSHGPVEMIMAGSIQALSSFISTGITARLVQHFSPIDNKLISYFFGSLVPATATFLLSYVGHKINQTPELLESCITPTLISYVTSYGTNFITRKGYFLPKDYPTKID